MGKIKILLICLFCIVGSIFITLSLSKKYMEYELTKSTDNIELVSSNRKGVFEPLFSLILKIKQNNLEKIYEKFDFNNSEGFLDLNGIYSTEKWDADIEKDTFNNFELGSYSTGVYSKETIFPAGLPGYPLSLLINIKGNDERSRAEFFDAFIQRFLDSLIKVKERNNIYDNLKIHWSRDDKSEILYINLKRNSWNQDIAIGLRFKIGEKTIVFDRRAIILDHFRFSKSFDSLTASKAYKVFLDLFQSTLDIFRNEQQNKNTNAYVSRLKINNVQIN